MKWGLKIIFFLEYFYGIILHNKQRSGSDMEKMFL